MGIESRKSTELEDLFASIVNLDSDEDSDKEKDNQQDKSDNNKPNKDDK